LGEGRLEVNVLLDTNALADVDKIAIETTIQDLAEHHDHYLYGISKQE
jgi:hypothetical protein